MATPPAAGPHDQRDDAASGPSNADPANGAERDGSDQRRAQLDHIAAGLGPPVDATSGNQHPDIPADAITSNTAPAHTTSQTARDRNADTVKRYS